MKRKLLPSSRVKKRYIVFSIDKEMGSSAIIKSIKDSFKELYGVTGLKKANIIFIKWFPELKKGIIRVNNMQANDLKASLAFIHEIEGEKTCIRCIGVSGILKKAINKFGGIKCNQCRIN